MWCYFFIWTFTGWDSGEHLVAVKCIKENRINFLLRHDEMRGEKCALKVQSVEMGVLRDF